MTVKLDQIKRWPAFRIVAQTIETKIMAGEILPGEVLPSELSLAAQMGVNRSTVREAIRLLEQNGLVHREIGKKKLLVTIPPANDLSKRVATALLLRQTTFDELWETMFALEPAAAAGAAKKRTDNLLAKIETNIVSSRQALEDSNSLTILDIEFHDLIAEASGNRAIQLARRPLGTLFYPAFYSVMSRLNAGQRLLFAHQQIYEAIRDQNAKVGVEWMEKHILDFKRGYELANLDMSNRVEMPQV